MRSATKLPAIPSLEAVDDATRRVLAPIKEIIEIREGRRGADYLDRAVTYRDLVDLGLITESQVPRKP